MEVLLIIVSVTLIAIVLLQSGKAEGTAQSILGGNSNLFANRKERGGELLISRFTMLIGMLFFFLCLFLSF